MDHDFTTAGQHRSVAVCHLLPSGWHYLLRRAPAEPGEDREEALEYNDRVCWERAER